MNGRRGEWQERSRRALIDALDVLCRRLESCGAATTLAPAGDDHDSALARLVRKFGLSAFERDLLLLAAGLDLQHPVLARHVAERGEARDGVPRLTFAIACAVLDQPHWSAIAPGATLRRARLITASHGAGGLDLAIDEAVLHALQGLAGLDDRLRPYVSRVGLVPDLDGGGDRVASDRLSQAWAHAAAGHRPRIVLSGPDVGRGAAVFATACAATGLTPFALDMTALPAERGLATEIIELWERDAVLHDLALFVETAGAESPERRALVHWVLARLSGFVAVWGDAGPVHDDVPTLRLDVERVTPAHQAVTWRHALGDLATRLDGDLDRITQQFTLGPQQIRDVATELRLGGAAGDDALRAHAWTLSRRHARRGLDDLAQRIEPRATWAQLVLPEIQLATLRSLATHVRHRTQVYDTWGFGGQSSRGLGITALFHGPSGTGKTFAAEAIAHDLDLDLYRVDLSATVSKYIGETEKNLRRIFDAAELGGAILLFDEADALFGKRSEVSDSHDRYANLEVSYLLQRMEAYRGLAILTTNARGALDQAFLRRLRFVVAFPFPAPADRERLWRSAFPTAVPLDPGVEWSRLSRLVVSGGNIANIALDAAFRAADAATAVGMAHLLAAAQAECAKIDKTITDTEVRGWL